MKPVSRFVRPLALDRTMSRGWMALEEENVEGWIARFSGGVTKRANSVLPSSAPEDLDACIAAVERRCASRGLPAVFHISPESLPADLDARLCERGHRFLSPTLVQHLSLKGCGNASTVVPDQRIELADEASPRWCEAFWAEKAPILPGNRRYAWKSCQRRRRCTLPWSMMGGSTELGALPWSGTWAGSTR